MIYTTRYSTASKLPRNKYHIVRTSLGGCRFCKADYNFSAIAPTREIFNIHLDEDGSFPPEYVKAYTKHLNDAFDVIQSEIEKLKAIVDKTIMLCCFCDLEEHGCHRRFFAKWYHEKTGYLIPEFSGLLKKV